MQRIFIITVLLFTPLKLLAEFSCKTEVIYTWKKDDLEKKVIYKNLYADFSSEEQGKIYLKREGERTKLAALKECNRNHENLANCIVSKLKNLAGTSASLGFKSRSMLEAAVEQDCKLQTGVCIGSELSEIVCQKNISLDASPVTSPEEDKGKKKK
jgi:hypothetical protein